MGNQHPTPNTMCPTCASLKQPAHVFDMKGSPANFSPSSLCFFLFSLVPPPVAVTLTSTPPFPSFLLSVHKLLQYLVLVDSLPALLKLVLSLGQVRVPLPSYPLVIVSCPRANASLLCKGCTICPSHNGYLCVQNPSLGNIRAGCIPHCCRLCGLQD